MLVNANYKSCSGKYRILLIAEIGRWLNEYQNVDLGTERYNVLKIELLF